MGLYSFLPMWFAVAAGRLSDRIGVRRPMLAGSCGLALGAALPPIFPGLPRAVRHHLPDRHLLHAVPGRHAERDRALSGRRSDARENFSLLALGYSVSELCRPAARRPAHRSRELRHDLPRARAARRSCPPPSWLAAASRCRSSHPRTRAGGRSGVVGRCFATAHLRRVFIVNALLSMAWDLHAFFIPIYGAKLGLSASVIGIDPGRVRRRDVRRPPGDAVDRAALRRSSKC